MARILAAGVSQSGRRNLARADSVPGNLFHAGEWELSLYPRFSGPVGSAAVRRAAGPGVRHECASSIRLLQRRALPPPWPSPPVTPHWSTPSRPLAPPPPPAL